MSVHLPRIAILMPTCNSTQFLAEQIDSLLRQTCRNFIIVTRDDGSTDASASLIKEFATAHPQLFHVISEDGRKLGASGNFSYMLQYTMKHRDVLGLDRVYVMFCDHDDVWYEHKVASTMQRMLALEKEAPAMPALVHSDLNVVDESKRQIAASFVKYQGIEPRKNGFARMLVSNTVTGCTAMINEELATLALPIPTQAIMHDWWLALVASAFGRIAFIDEALLDYRQHGANTIGAKEYRKSGRQNLARRLLDNQHAHTFRRIAEQAALFRARYGKQLTVLQKLSLILARLMYVPAAPVQKLLLKLLR